MSMDISAAPAAGPKAVVSHDHAHAKDGQEDAAAFTDLLSGKPKHPASARDGEAQAKSAGHGAGKWHMREHAQWRVFEAVKAGRRDEAADGAEATDEEVPVEAEGQAQQVAMLLGPQLKAVATAAAGAGHAKEGAAIAKEAGAEAAVADMTAQPGRKRQAATENAQVSASERHAATASDARHGPMEAAPASREVSVEAPKPADATATAPETGRERGARVQEREPAGERSAPKVTVMSVQTAPAPAAPTNAPNLSPTSASFVQSLGAPDGLPRYVSETGSQGSAQNAPKPVTTLKIQLHPVDLGTVTAKLSGDSDKLSIEVQVENHEAHHRLQSDGDAIVKALRGMGFDIDRITVQQAPQTGASPGGTSNRENGFAAPDQRAGDGRGQSGRQDTGRGYDEGRNQGSGSGSDRGEARGSSGVYI